MTDWKKLLLKMLFLILPSCVQTKKRNHTGETKSWSPAGGPIYSSTETNSFRLEVLFTFQQKKIFGYQLEVLCTVQEKQIFGHRLEVLYAV
jgi:hypothetical protein